MTILFIVMFCFGPKDVHSFFVMANRWQTAILSAVLTEEDDPHWGNSLRCLICGGRSTSEQRCAILVRSVSALVEEI